MRLALGIFVLFLATFHTSASAEPATIAAAVAWVAEVWGVIGVYVQVAVAVYGIATTVQAGKTADYNQRKARDDYNAGLKDRTATRITNDAPHRYVYGEARVGSDIVAVFTSGDRDQYKHLVCVHAAHECTEIKEVWVAGKRLGAIGMDGWVTSDPEYRDDYGVKTPQPYYTGETTSFTFQVTGSNTFILNYAPVAGSIRVVDNTLLGGTVQATEYPFTMAGLVGTIQGEVPPSFYVTYQSIQSSSRVRVSKHLGETNQIADAGLITAVPTKWDNNCRLLGLCYTVITLDLNQTEFQGGLPSIEVLIKGKKILDPRDGSTSYKNNAALVLYDYLRSPLCLIPTADLPVSYYITAANVCDETYLVAGVPTAGKYQINGTITSAQSQIKVIESLSQAMAGGVVATTWECYAGKYVAPVKTLTQDDVVGNLLVTPSLSDASISNGFKGQYISKSNSYVSTDFKPYSNPTYVAADGNEVWLNMDFAFTDDLQRVHNLCRIFLEDQRNSFTLKAVFSLKAWDLKVGERIKFTSAFLGQTDKVYRVMSKSFSPTNAVELTLKEDDPSIWDYSDSVVVDSTPNTNLKDPFSISPITSLQCESGTATLLVNSDGTIDSRILLTWAGVQDTSTSIEIEYQSVGTTTWLTYNTSGDVNSAYIPNVVDKLMYTIRARRVNLSMAVSSDWVYATHKVVGKTQPPSNVSVFNGARVAGGFDIKWNKITDVDADLYEIRVGSIWETATQVYKGRVNSFYYKTTKPDTYIVKIKAIDTSGNYSSTETTVSLVRPYTPTPPWFGIEAKTLTWGTVSDVDLAGYEVRFQYGLNTSWADASKINSGVVTQSPFVIDVIPQGQITLMLRSVDVNGYYSTTSAVIKTEFGNPIIANVVNTIDFKVGGYQGLLIGCSIISGSLYADTTSVFYKGDNSLFYSEYDSTTFYNDYYSSMVYETVPFTPTTVQVGSNMTLLSSFIGEGRKIEYRVSGGNPFYSPIGTEVFFLDDSTLFWGNDPDWQVWIGQVETKNLQYQFRFSAMQSTTQAILDTCQIVIDVPDISESINNFVVSSSGTRLPIINTYTAIENIQITLEYDGGTAIKPEIADKNPILGPLIRCRDQSGALVAGKIDAIIQGY